MQNKVKALVKKPFLLYLSILLFVIFAIWFYLWFGLAAYEAGIPKNLISTVTEEIKDEADAKGNCQTLLSKYNYTPIFGSLAENGEVLARLAADKEISYKKVAALSGDGSLAYSVLADQEEIAIILLSAREDEGIMGLSLYEVSRISGAKKITILANPDMSVRADGVELGENIIRNPGVVPKELQKLAAYPQNIIEVPQYTEYLLDGLFSIPEITGISKDGDTVEGIFVREDFLMIGEPPAN